MKHFFYIVFTTIFFLGNQSFCTAKTNADKNPPDEYWSSPQKQYKERWQLYLNYSATRSAVGDGRDAVFAQISKLELGLPLNEDIIRESIAFVYSNKDCNDFAVGGLVRLLYLDKSKKKLSPQLCKDVEQCLIDFKYWWDEPKKDVLYRCYHTENHQGLYHSDELLAGQLFKDKIFNNGQDGKYHIQHASVLLKRWLDYRAKFGFSEWLSNSYYDVDLMQLANLNDFAEDPTIRAKAGLVIDLLMYDMALHNFHGVFGSTHGRAYAGSVKGGRLEATSSIMKLMFGVGIFNSHNSMGAVALATSAYRCPKVIEDIATDYSQNLIIRQRQSLAVEDAPKYGISFDNELDGHFFWGMQEFIHPLVIKTSMEISQKYNTWPYKNYENYIKKYEKQKEDYGKIVNPNLDRFAMAEVNIETYRTPNYMLSCAQNFRPGTQGYQQHIWQATLGIDAVVFTNHAGFKGEKVSPSFWAGNESLPKAAQYKNTLICIYNLPESTSSIFSHSALPYSHAYFPKKAFDEVIENGNWVFGRKNDGYIALYSQKKAQWKSDKDGIENELIANATKNIWICELGSAKEWKSFEAFVKAISSGKVNVNSLAVNYNSASNGKIKFGWNDPLVVNGKEQPLTKYPRFDNPFSQTEFPAEKILIKKNHKELIIDFTQNIRIEK